MTKDEALDLEKLKHWLWYQPQTGLFRWRYASHNRMIAPWDVAGCPDDKGYIKITLLGKSYRAHHLAWLFMTGALPKSLIDHKNRNKSDNSWENLRQADQNQNQWNTATRIDNKSGVKGVHFCKTWNRWVALVRVNGVRHHVGRFATIEEAQKAVTEFRSKYHGEYAS
jgi:hypothetical protein